MDYKISDELKKLEAQCLEIQRTIEKIKEKIELPVDNTISMNFIEKQSKNNAFTNHPLGKIDRDIAFKYCLILAMFIEASKDNEVKNRQYYFAFRLYHFWAKDFIAEELCREARIENIDDLSFIKDNMEKKQLEQLLFDIIILIGIGGQDERQVDYFGEFIAFFGLKISLISTKLKLAKAIMEGDISKLLDHIKYMDISPYFGYLGCDEEDVVTTNFSGLSKINFNTALIKDAVIRDLKTKIHLEKFDKKEIFFYNCTFESILGIIGGSVKVHFINCSFDNCKRLRMAASGSRFKFQIGQEKDCFIQCKNSEFINTKFTDCYLLGFKSESCLFDFEECNIKDCTFMGCQVGISESNESKECNIIDLTGCLVNSRNSVIKNTEFLSCFIQGEGIPQELKLSNISLLNMKEGVVSDCSFTNCKTVLSKTNTLNGIGSILEIDKSTKESNVIFKGCKVEKTRHYSWDTDGIEYQLKFVRDLL